MTRLLALFLLLTATSVVFAADTWGTAQLPGDVGAMGQVYKIRHDSPLYFRLNSAEFTVNQVRIGDALCTAAADQKLLVLNFSVQNPQQDEVLARNDQLKMTVVDAVNVNHEGDNDWGEATTHARVEMMLKPAQRIDAYTVIQVPAKGPIPKLIVMSLSDDDGPVLRYDLRDKIAKLQPPVADPEDATGATALEIVPAQLNTPCATGGFTVVVEKYQMITTALEGDAPAEGDHYFVATLLCHNLNSDERTLRFDTFILTLKDADGMEMESGGTLLGATANRSFDQGVRADSSTRVRLYFTVPKDVLPKTFSLQEPSGRIYEFDVSK
ncbi:MAG: DUF4352 domain-containing protein [Armatimonadota bacterium]